ncbi:MAG: TetR/AcrR family transcriptional regulator [Lachnospiraceae bacterium]|nr:TetR/AcrR family transcriptional regulator [Lachnospiraceae bacterium]
MGKKDFGKISITEITKHAGVSRTAFYRNYETREALVEDICQSLFSELKASVSGERYRTDRKAWYTIFFKTIKENSEYFQIYLNAHLQFGELFILESVYPPTTPLERYVNSAKEGAFLRVLTVWFNGGMQESPEEMGEICEKLIYNAFEACQDGGAANVF